MSVERLDLSCDVLVAGGGPSGAACALAAARTGASVILCQDRSVLGGNASSEIRMHMVGADASGKRGVHLKTEAREGGLIEEIRLETAYRNPQRSASMLDLILYEKCHAEPGLRLMLNTTVDGVELDGGVIVAAHATRASTEDCFRFAAQVFVDCTGDGRLGVEAGAAYREGREAASEFGESRAGISADNHRLGSSLLFQARDMGRPMRYVPPEFARRFTEEDLVLRDHRSLEYGYWWVEWGGSRDTIKDNEEIRHELLAIMHGVWDHIKNGADHGADNWALTWFGFVPGKRESRRFDGQYRITQSDLEDAVEFSDGIAVGGWPLDTHPPEGIDDSDQPPCDQPLPEYLYTIPLRACVSENVPNLMFAGRNISASHLAFSSTRVMATCASVGQAVGTAAALGVRSEVVPRDMAAQALFVRELQQTLVRDDCFIPGVKAEDDLDGARSAQVTASSYVEGGRPGSILSGETRAVSGPGGVRPGMTDPGVHRWMSDPDLGFPAWIQLEWDKPTVVGEIRITFDTGQHRVLTLSHDDRYTQRMVWGPQPETVKDYRLIYSDGDDTWRELISERENYQRLRVHRFDPAVSVRRLRLVVESSWGLGHARVIEIRCLPAWTSAPN